VSRARVAIIDNGGANVASLAFALERLGVEATLTRDPESLAAATHVILPGVGAARDAMQRLERAGLADAIRDLDRPLLGICLGMQLLFESSEEGDTRCLGIIPGRLRRFAAAPGRPVPHMGWNRITLRAPSALLDGLADGDYCYFVHSYAAPLNACTVASTEYGGSFASVVIAPPYYGTQFHPERSAQAGRRILENFLRL
jgi:glutamine amidotransferase